MRERTIWVDRVEDQNSGDVIQEGTPLSAAKFNNIEDDLDDQEIAHKLLLIYARETARYINNNVVEEYQEIALTNTASQPFNNSETTVSLSNTRDNTQYTVDKTVIDSDGLVGDVEVYDKQTNGFKLRYTGSAATATVAVIIKGGLV